ncbi:MAG: thioesterase family protein [Balneola sp.]
MIKPDYDPDFFYHWHKLTVRFSDVDALQHVNNAIFNTYYEESRLRFLGEYFKMNKEFHEGRSFVMVRSEIEYLGQIKFPDSILIGTGISKVGNSSLDAFQAIYHSETKKLLSVANTTGVWFDINKQRPVRLPEIKDLDAILIKSDQDG